MVQQLGGLIPEFVPSICPILRPSNHQVYKWLTELVTFFFLVGGVGQNLSSQIFNRRLVIYDPLQIQKWHLVRLVTFPLPSLEKQSRSNPLQKKLPPFGTHPRGSTPEPIFFGFRGSKFLGRNRKPFGFGMILQKAMERGFPSTK